MKPREMLRKGIADLPQVLPWALGPPGSLAGVLSLKTGLDGPREGDGATKAVKNEEA